MGSKDKKSNNNSSNSIILTYKNNNYIKAYLHSTDEFEEELEKLMSQEAYYGELNYY